MATAADYAATRGSYERASERRAMILTLAALATLALLAVVALTAGAQQDEAGLRGGARTQSRRVNLLLLLRPRPLLTGRPCL